MKVTFAALAVSLVLAGCASGPKPEEHDAHHPPETAAAATAPALTAGQMDMQMKSMQAMHDRMMAAKTPEERAALMADHMKAMQDGMAMMDRMKAGRGGMGMGGAMPMSPEMMGQRMEMMEMMMKMMMGRESAQPPATK